MSLAQALRSLFQPGDEIIVTNQDHEANGGAWRRLEEFGLTIREWTIDRDSGELDLAVLDGLLNERTRLVCFPHVSNIVGTVNPVAEIAAKVHAAGAMVCVDGVAYAAHHLIDVKAWDVDFYLFSLYKLYGPHIALLYGKRERIAAAKNQNHFFHEGHPPATLNPGGNNYEAVASLTGIIDYFEALYRHHFDQPENSQHGRLARVFELFGAQRRATVGEAAGLSARQAGRAGDRQANGRGPLPDLFHHRGGAQAGRTVGRPGRTEDRRQPRPFLRLSLRRGCGRRSGGRASCASPSCTTTRKPRSTA